MAARRPKEYKGKQPNKNNPRSQISSKLNERTHPSSNKANNRSQGEHGGTSNSQRKGNGRSGQETWSCHKCGRKGHLANDCRTPEYFVNLYKELQQLKAKQHKIHTLDAPILDTTENCMVSDFQTDLRVSFGVAVKGAALRESIHAASIHSEVVLLDSATTHTI